MPVGRSSQDYQHNLPAALTSFVGRERELADVKWLLGSTRLLTLTGSGGVGKTRLALELGWNVLPDYPDGVWLVDLAPLGDPSLVPYVAATALGVREAPGRSVTDVLADVLRPHHMLLILDNCEHLVDACASLADALLRSCPELQIVATGRQSLSLAGETAWRVPSLSLPWPPRPAPEMPITQYEAVRLFLDRANAALP